MHGFKVFSVAKDGLNRIAKEIRYCSMEENKIWKIVLVKLY